MRADSLEEWACDDCHDIFYTNSKMSCDCPSCGCRARYCGTLYFQQVGKPAEAIAAALKSEESKNLTRTGVPVSIEGGMHSYVIDLCSFSVEAKNEDEARKEAIRVLETGEEEPKVENVTLDE